MSRRLLALTLVALLSLVATGGVIPGLASSAAATPYGSHVFASNPYVIPGAQSYPVYAASTVAQSFTAPETFSLENVTLRVINSGNATNFLRVTIHPDDPTTHLPVMSTTLANWSEATPNNNPEPVNASWDFNPPPLLVGGQTYWIVAQNSAPQSSTGYQWLSTDGDTYAGGDALLDATTGWSGLPYDLFFITYGQQHDANLTPSLTVTPALAQPGQSVTFTAAFNNTGSTTARTVWVNDTWPVALTNVTLSFPGIQPISAAAFPNLVFANVSNGPHEFQITAQVAIGTPPGTLVTNAVRVAYVNVTGEVVQGGTSSASVRVGLVTKQMYLAGTSGSPQLLTTAQPTQSVPQTSTILPNGSLEFTLAPAFAVPFHAWSLTTRLWLQTSSGPPQSYRLTLELLDNASTVASLSPSFQVTAPGLRPYTFAFPVSNVSFAAGHVVGLRLTNLGGGSGSTDNLVVAYNSTLNASQVDALTDTYVSMRPLGLGNQNGPTSTWSTLDRLMVLANVSDPFGASRIRGAWINITTPTSHLAAAGAMSFLLADGSSRPAWELFEYTLAPPLLVGDYRIVVQAMEDNGVASLAAALAQVAVPAFTLTTNPASLQVGEGETFPFYLYYNNTGTAVAPHAWINDTLPAELSFVTSSLSVTSVSGSTYTWALANVSVGPHRLEIDAIVTDPSLAWVQNDATLDWQDSSGHAFARLYSNLSAILNGPVLSLSILPTPAGTIHSNESVSYAFTLTNTGAPAVAVWLNDTLPVEFTYASNTAETLGAILTRSGSVLQFVFPEMLPNVTWTFDIVATAGPSLARNATYANGVTVAYASLTGVPMPGIGRNVGLTAASPWIPWGSLLFPVNNVLPGDTAPLVIRFTNLGNERAPWVWVNLTFDSRLAMTNATRPFTAGPGSAAFVLTNVPEGTLSIFANLSVDSAVPDHGALTVLGGLDARDGFGNPLPTAFFSPATLFISAAELSLFVTPVSPRLEAGVPSSLEVSGTNWGRDVVANAWLNLTLPSSPPTILYMNDTSPTPPVVSGFLYSWHWVNMTPGPFSLRVYIEAPATVANGTTAILSFTLNYEGSNGRARPSITNAVEATIIAPTLALTLRASAASIVTGTPLQYTLTMQNTGMTPAATVYLVNVVDPRLQVITFAASAPATIANGTYNWTFTNLAPGETQTLNLTVNVLGGVPAQTIIPTVFEATYTNSAGVLVKTVRSAPVTVTVVSDYTLLEALGAGVAAILLTAVVLRQRKRVEIEEVFLVYRDGVLISHLSRTLMREKDEDVLSGMLTAVQEFVREAFQYGERHDLQQLDFGDYRILIERGKYVYLAIVYSGKESTTLHKKVRAVIDRVEGQFGPALENWDGDMDQVVGARDLLRDTLLGSGNRNHAPKPTSDSE